MAETLTRITPSLSYDSLKEADLVVEAVVELETVKRQVYQETEEVIAEDAVLASNTSTISITKLARVLKIQSVSVVCIFSIRYTGCLWWK